MPLPPRSVPCPQSYDQDRRDHLIAALDDALTISYEMMELVAMLDDTDRVDQESPEEALGNERQTQQ
jgi:hypothetical protein